VLCAWGMQRPRTSLILRIATRPCSLPSQTLSCIPNPDSEHCPGRHPVLSPPLGRETRRSSTFLGAALSCPASSAPAPSRQRWFPLRSLPLLAALASGTSGARTGAVDVRARQGSVDSERRLRALTALPSSAYSAQQRRPLLHRGTAPTPGLHGPGRLGRARMRPILRLLNCAFGKR